MFIGETELAVITGYKIPSKQIEWLTQRNITHVVSGKGRPVVLREVLELAIQDTGPNSHHANFERRQKKTKIGLDDIMNAKVLAPMTCGIYFLIKNGKIIYIGQSTNILYRVGTHAKKVEFDYYSYIQCDKNELNEIESRLIKKFHPSLNIMCRTIEL